MTVTPAALLVELIDHPAPAVRQRGLQVDHPYLERCWTHLVGPTAVVLLRCLHWRGSGSGTRLEPGELTAILGLGKGGSASALWRSLNRLARFGLVHWEGERVEVYLQVAPLAPNQLMRAPRPVQDAHHQLWSSP